MKNWKSKQTSKAMEILHHLPKGEWLHSLPTMASLETKMPLFFLYPVSPPYILPQAYLSGQGQSGGKKQALTLRDKKQETSRVQLLWKKFNPSQASQVHSDN